MTEHKTVDYLLNHHCSLARFGDGELAIAAYGCGIGFQEADPELQAARNEIIADDDPNILLCLPGRINYVRKKDRAVPPEYWQKELPRHYHMWTRKFSKTRQYGETKSEVSDHPILIHSIGPDGRIIRLLNQDSTCRRQDMSTFYRVNGAIYILKVSDINSDTSFNDVPVPYKKTLLISIVWMILCLQKSSCLPKHKQGLIGILTAGFPAYTRKAIWTRQSLTAPALIVHLILLKEKIVSEAIKCKS